MKRKFHLIVALVVAIALSSGIYAYTYSTASGIMGAAAVEENIVAVELAVGQPDWNSVLTGVGDEYGECEYGDWVYWGGGGDEIELNHVHHQCLIIPQALEKLESDHCHHLNIVLQGYTEEIAIDHSHHITIWAEGGYGNLEQEHSKHITITVGPGPAPPTEGKVPTGNLFVVTPHADYTGNLLVKVYLTNTGALSAAYQNFSLKLTLAGSVDGVQLLNLDSGVATFNLEGGAGAAHTLKVIGGNYVLVSANPEEWEESWSVTPEFYCEATQR